MSQPLNITGSSNGLSFTASVQGSNPGWLIFPSTSGTTPAQLNVAATPAGLSAGPQQSANILIQGVGFNYTTTVPVLLTVNSNGPSVTVTPTALSFAYTLNGALPGPQTITATGPFTGFTVTAPTTTGVGFLQVAPTSSNAALPANISVGLNPSVVQGLGVGTYTQNVVFTPTQAPQSAVTIPVSLVISGPPTATLSPTQLTFNYQTGPGTQNITTQTLTLTLTPAQALSFGVTSSVTSPPGGNWLSTLPSTLPTGVTSSAGTATISVSVSPTGLAPGTYQGTVTVQGGTSFSPVSIPVTLVVSNLPLINVPSTPLSFTYQVGTTIAPPAQSVTVTSTSTSSNSIYFVSATSTPTAWLKVSASNGVTPGPFSVTVDPNTGLGKGTYTGSISVIGQGTGNGAQTIPVTLTVTNDALISANLAGCNTPPTTSCSISIPYQINGTNNPSSTLITLNSSTGAGLNYTVTPSSSACGGNWLLVNGSTGATTGQTAGTVSSTSSVSLSANPAGIAAGTSCAGTITIAANNAGTGQATPNSPLTIPVTLTVSSGGQLVVTPAAGVTSGPGLTFTAPAGGQTPAQQTLTVGSTGSDVLNYTAVFTPDNGGTWLPANVQAGSTVSPSNVITVFVNPNGLTAGTYTGTLKITATGPGGAAVANSPLMIPIVLQLTNGTLSVNPASLSFTQTVGGASPTNQTLSISSNGQPLNFTVAAANDILVPWLSVSGSATGTTPGSATIAVDGSKLSAGVYNGMITVTAPGSSNSLKVPVTLTVAAGGLNATPTSLSFSQVAGGTAPAAQTVNVSSTGTSFPFTVSTTTKDGGTWLSATPASGSTASNVSVSVSAGTLAPGTYSGTVTITAAGASGSPLAIPVTFTVTAASALVAAPASVNFSFVSGTTVPPAQTVQLTSSGANSTFTVTTSTKDGAAWLTATPTSGTTPASLSIAVSPAALSAGNYSGTVTVTSPNSLSALTIPVSLTVAAIPTPVITAIGNAASYAVGAVSPGENVVIFGTNIGPSPLAGGVLTSAGTAFDTTAGDTQVLFDGVPAPVIYASAGQTSVMVPYGVAGRTSTTITLSYKGVKSAPITQNVVLTSPGIYTLNQSGSGPGAILNQNLLTVPTAATPAPKGSVVSVYMTGEGQTIGNLDGFIATTLKSPVAGVTATVAGIPATVTYAGTSPGIVNGVMQVNVQIPANAPSGVQPIVITVGTASTQANVTLVIQ